MPGLAGRLVFGLALFLPIALHGQVSQPLAEAASRAALSTPALSGSQLNKLYRDAARQPGNTLAMRPFTALSPKNRAQPRVAVPHLQPGNHPWQQIGPLQITTPQFGSITGRITSVAIAPWDASGNTVYIGATGGGVWKSTNAAAGNPAMVTFQPLTDDPPAYSGVNITSLSIGAVSVQPGTAPNGVVLAGTGDPNNAVDSYYGAGILRSPDGGATWSLTSESRDGFSGGLTNYSFAGNAFSGFAWSTVNTRLVVAAVTDTYDGLVNNINDSGGALKYAEAGLYYSTDAGQTWFLSTIEDGPNQVIQSSQITNPSSFPGVPVSAVVWNAARNMFYAAMQLHGYYQSPDGVTWTRMANQPGSGLTRTDCPANPGFVGSNSCPIFRGALAVQPVTGDMFALTIDMNNVDQGVWQDVCNLGVNGCANPTVQFGVNIPDAALDTFSVGIPYIAQGTYNLTLAAVPNGGDTLLFAGTTDEFRCSLAAGCAWRNTTNSESCASAQVAPAQHGVAFLAPPAGGTQPLLYFGNDGGLWRSVDGVNETGASCSPTDATHYQNLNGGLGSLAEVTSVASDPADANVLLAAFGTSGSAAGASATASAWPQILSGYGGVTAIDPGDPANWYATLGPYVAIGQCTLGASCTAADFGNQPAIGAPQTSADESLLSAPYTLDPQDAANILVGTCRVWRGPAAGGDTWDAANAISPMFDGHAQPYCSGNAMVRSLAAGGPNVQSSMGAQNSGSQVIYAGMAGLLDGGGASVGGHVFATQAANLANGTTKWTDLASSPVADEQSYGGIFNPYLFDVSSLYVDPHDSTGNTVYATIQGFGVPHLYYSADGGASWTNISKNLPDLPLNAIVVDPNNASVVYAASDGGVFVTQNVAACLQSGGQCWNILGTGLPLAPAVTLSTTTANGGYLRVGTYGRGIWQIPLLSGTPQTSMSAAPTSLVFDAQAVQTSSAGQTVTITNTGSAALNVGSISTAGDFRETDSCGASIPRNGNCKIQVTFTPSTTGALTGTLTIFGNVPGGQQTVTLTGTGTSPSQIVLLPSSMNFGGQPINTTSAAQQLTISNTSGSSVSLTSETVTGPFAIQTNTCSSTLASQTGCTLALVFKPTQTGAANGVLTVITGQGTETVGLSGAGDNSATDTLSPTSLSFPATVENASSAPQKIMLTNSGGTPLTGIEVQTTGDFAVVNSCSYSLNPQSSCTLTVTYTPHAAGAETGTIVVTDMLRIQIVTLSGTGIAPPTDTLSANSLVFPATVVGHTANPQTVSITNSGDLALANISITVKGAGFGESTTCSRTLAAHTSCTVTATFQPQSAGNAVGQIDISDALRTEVVSLSGSGEIPAEDNLSPTSIAFGQQTVGTTSPPHPVTLSNNSTGTLNGVRIESSSPDFPFTTNCGTSLGAGNSCVIQSAFAPHAAARDSGALTIIDLDHTQTVSLTGTGTLAHVTLAPARLDFGISGIQIASAPRIVQLSNGSGATLSGISISTAGPYPQSNTCGSSLVAGATCIVQVVFQPSAAGAVAGALNVVTSNAGNMIAQMTGTGIAFDLLPTSATSVSVTSGHAASYSLELTPASGSAGNVALTCGNIPPNSTCTVTPTNPSLGAPANIQVAVATGVAVSAQVRAAGFPVLRSWRFGFIAMLLLLGMLRKRSRAMRARMHHFLLTLLLLAVLGSATACGKGVGPLGVGASGNPLPASSLTPSGTYTLNVTASAGGLQKTVALTLQVH